MRKRLSRRGGGGVIIEKYFFRLFRSVQNNEKNPVRRAWAPRAPLDTNDGRALFFL